MSIRKTTSKLAGVLGAAALVFSLAACSGGQSVAEACKVVGTSVAETQGGLQSAATEVMSGNGNFSDLFADAKNAFVEVEKKVQNSEVSDALKAMSDDFETAGALFKDIKMPNMADLDPTDPETMAAFEEMGAQFQEKRGELEDLQASLEKSTTKFQDLCNI